MKPTVKSENIENFLENIFGRSSSIRNNSCVFCKTSVGKFKDELSESEYRISGMCQKCQDEVFY